MAHYIVVYDRLIPCLYTITYKLQLCSAVLSCMRMHLPRKAVVALAGKVFSVVPGMPWWGAVPKENWPEGLEEHSYVVTHNRALCFCSTFINIKC